MKYAGEHRVLHRVVQVGHLALVEPLGVVEGEHVGVAEPGVLLLFCQAPSWQGDFCTQCRARVRQVSASTIRAARPEPLAAVAGVVAERAADRLRQPGDEPVGPARARLPAPHAARPPPRATANTDWPNGGRNRPLGPRHRADHGPVVPAQRRPRHAGSSGRSA